MVAAVRKYATLILVIGSFGLGGVVVLGAELPPCDDFEDGVIDSSLWEWGGLNRATYGGQGGSWEWSHEEVIDPGDGYLGMRVWGPPSGNTFGAEAWVRTLYDYNDGVNHVINFTWEAAVQDSHYNLYFLQVTDGYISTNGNPHWPVLEAPIPGTTDLLWRVVGDQAFPGASYPTGLGKSAWSMTINPSGLAVLYDGRDACGSVISSEPLDSAYPWYVRFMVLDATSSGFPGGDIRLNLYDFCKGGIPSLLPPGSTDIGFGTRMRDLSFVGGTPDASEAVRVQFDVDGVTRTMYVGQPVEVSESSQEAGPTPPPTFWAARLQCAPFFTDWSAYPAIHAFDESVVPSSVYDLSLVASGCQSNEAAYSPPLTIVTSKWGDVGGERYVDDSNCSVSASGYTDCWNSPDGDADFDDITSVVDKFRNLPGAPAKSRVDVAPEIPDFIVDFTDIPEVVDAFRGLPYPYPGPPTIDPCVP